MRKFIIPNIIVASAFAVLGCAESDNTLIIRGDISDSSDFSGPDTTQEPQEPQQPVDTENPDAPGIPDTPDSPQDPDTPDSPQDPDTPVTPEEPPVTPEEPPVTPEEPPVTPEEPPVTPEEPPVTPEEPPVTPEEPPVTPEEPPVTPEEPPVTPEEPPIVVPKADLLDVEFHKDGSASNISGSQLTVQAVAPTSFSIYYNPQYSRYTAHFNNPLGGTASGYYKVDFTNLPDIQNALADGHSLEAVFRLDTPHDGTKEAKFFAAHQSGGTGFLISKTDNGQDITFLPYVGDNYVWCGSGIKPQVGKYYHVVGVWDRNTASIYVNGELKKSVKTSGNYKHGSEKWFGIGCDAANGTGNIAWTGDVAIARIYDRPLEASEIAMLYQDTKPASDAQFVITSIDANTSCELSHGYKYHIYGNGFQAGDTVKFISRSTDQVIACSSSVAGNRITAVIPNTLNTDSYTIVIDRNGALFPIASGTIKITSNAPSCMNVKAVAHRGYHPDTSHPENSIASLKYAQDLGVYGSEFDVWMTKDGDLFINHDGKLNNVTIQTSSTATVKKQKLSNGEYIPTLQAYLEQGKKVPSIKMILEIKTHSSASANKKVTEKCINLVKSLNMTEQVEWIAFDYSICKQIRAALPNAVVQYLNGDKAPSALAKEKISAIDYSMKVLNNNPKWIQEAHDNQMFVNVWTVPKADFKTWISKNVDVITTNDAKDLMQTVRIYAEK